MAYDYHSPGSKPGPISPVNWVRGTAVYARSMFGANKLLVGLALYGYDWNTTTGAKATATKYPDIAYLRRTYNATLSYDTASQSAKATYTRDGQRHEVWYETGRTLDAKLAVARDLGAAGVAVWRLGQEDPRVWNSIRGLSVGMSQSVFSPNGDGYEDSVTVSYRLDSTATVSATVRDASGRTVRTLQQPVQLTAGVRTLRWDGRDGSGVRLPDGSYTVRVLATVGGSPVSDTKGVSLNTSLGRLAMSPASFAPSRTRLSASYSLAVPARVTVSVMDGSQVVRTLTPRTSLAAGRYTVTWDGRTSSGAAAPEGGYAIRVVAESGAGRSTALRDAYLDQRAPVVSNGRVSSPSYYVNGGTIQSWSCYLSEDAAVELQVLRSGRVVSIIKQPGRQSGRNTASWTGYISGALAPAGTYSYRIVAVDAAGNASTAETGSFAVVR